MGCLLAAPTAAGAEEIHLKNGKVIEGDVEIAGDRVLIRPWDAGASIVLSRDRIREILPKERPVEPPENAEAPLDAPEDRDSPGPAAEGVEIDPPGMAMDAPDAESSPRPASEDSAQPRMPRIGYFYTPVPDAQVRAAIESVFPRIVRVCVEELGMKFKGYVPLVIEVVHDIERYQAYETWVFGPHFQSEGFYVPSLDRIIVRGNHIRLSIVSTLYHEGVHAFMYREFPYPPPWLNEGLAEFFEGFRVQGRSTLVLDPDYHDVFTKRLVSQGRMIPLHEYLNLSADDWRALDRQRENDRHPRSIAWSLITFLMSHEEGQEAFRQYLQALKSAQGAEGLAAAYDAFDAAYPGGVQKLERRWHGWILDIREPLKY